MSAIDRLFVDHPHSVGESYAEHGLFALRFSARLLMAGGAALVHAIIPCLCETTASRMVLAMHAEIVTRRARAAQPHATSAALQAH